MNNVTISLANASSNEPLYLTGNKENGSVALSTKGGPSYPKTVWNSTSDGTKGYYYFECLDEYKSPNKYLDGVNANDSVQLSPKDSIHTGTSWELINRGGGKFALRCAASEPGKGYLSGDPVTRMVSLAPNIILNEEWNIVLISTLVPSV